MTPRPWPHMHMHMHACMQSTQHALISNSSTCASTILSHKHVHKHTCACTKMMQARAHTLIAHPLSHD